MDNPRRPPIAFAHRGARLERRENTIEAFSRALELGASGLESDAWLTADGVVVLDHDGVIGPPLRRRHIREQLRDALPEYIPSLTDLYQRLGTTFELSLDIKDPWALGSIVSVAAEAGALERLWLCDANLGRVQEGVPSAAPGHMVLSTHLEDLERTLPGGIDEAVPILAGAGVAALNLHGSEWTPERVRLAHDAGLLAFGWDAQSEYHISRLVTLGLDGIYSDHVDRLVAAIAPVARPR